MVTEEQIIRLMVEDFPECPLCGSGLGYEVTSVIKGHVKCRSCGAEWFSLDFVKSARLKKLAIKELPHGAQSYSVGEHVLRRYDEYPSYFWKSLGAGKERGYGFGLSIIELPLLIMIVIIASYFRLANLTEISSWHDFDEGVHSQAAVFYIQGYVPYRDFFFTQPPLILYVLNVLYRLNGPDLGAGRMFSATLSTLTIIAVYFVGRASGSPIAGYIASAFVAFDGYTIYNSRKLMLEPSMTFFACISYLSFVYSVQNEGEGKRDFLMLLSGFLMGFSISAKIAAVFNWAPLFIYLVLRRDKRALSLFMLSSIVSVALLLIPFLVNARGEVVKQILIFQILRPPDGTPRNERLRWMTSHEPDRIIIYTGLFSLAVVLLACLLHLLLLLRHKTAKSPLKPSVTLPMLWALSVLFMFLNTKSFYGHYVEQIIPPFALLAGNVATEIPEAISGLKGRGRVIGKALKVVFTLGLAAAIITQFSIISLQKIPTWENNRPREVADGLSNLTTREDEILTFEPMFTFMAERTPTGLMCDAYGTMLYTGLHLDEDDLATAFIRALTQKEYPTWPIHDPEAQEYVMDLFRQSDYVVAGDYRSKWQLTQESLDFISDRTSIVEEIQGIRVLIREGSAR